MNMQQRIDRIKLAKKDAENEHRHSLNTDFKDEKFWEGYLAGIDYALFILNHDVYSLRKGL